MIVGVGDGELDVETGRPSRLSAVKRRHAQLVSTRHLAVQSACRNTTYSFNSNCQGWLGSRVVSVLDSDAKEPGFKSQPRRCRVTVLGKLFTPIVPLFTKQQNW